MISVDEINKLKKENERLKRENEIITGMHNSSRNRFDKLYNTLQEIKAIAETCMTKDACFECKYSDDCHIEDTEIPTYDICKLLIQKLTKAEEE